MPEMKQPTILIVDDETANIQVLANVLRPIYRILFTTRGSKAVEMAENALPDLILLDVVMPDEDGYAVCRQLKASSITTDIPVIFVTGMTEEQSEAVGFEMGGVDYITKPINPSLLTARVRTHIELKRRGDHLKRLTTLDGLTGIANRRRMDEFLQSEWLRAVRRDNSELSLVMLDVDHFKNYNDHYGHQQGDDCLKQVATVIESSLFRATDLAARYGGEEFACILPETPAEGAMKLGEKIRGAIMGLNIPHAASKVSDVVTVSVGAASIIPRQKTRPSLLVETADQQLYRAKQEGRNRVMTTVVGDG